MPKEKHDSIAAGAALRLVIGNLQLDSTEYHVEMNYQKPKFGEKCTGCGYCCTVGPCKLAQEFLHCVTGPCVALEASEGGTICGLVRNPLGYLYKATHPDADVPLLDAPPAVEAGYQLSVKFAAALGVGKGCDADDDFESTQWSLSSSI